MVEERRRREHHRLDLAVPLCLLGYPPVGRGGRRSGLRRSWWNWLPDRWGRILQRCKPTPRGQKPVANTMISFVYALVHIIARKGSDGGNAG